MKAQFSISALVSLLTNISLIHSAPVTWDGEGGDRSWQNPVNWSGNVLPGPSDDVTIAGTGDVIFSGGSATIRSLQASRNFTLRGGILTVTSGSSTIQGALALEGGALYARGGGTFFNATGATAMGGADVYAEQGASVSLTTLANVSVPVATDVFFSATDAGSVINLPNLSEAAVQDYYHFRIMAADGGRVSAPRLSKVDGSIDVFAADPNSVIDLSGLRDTLGNSSPGSARLEARDGGAILLPNVTDLDGVNLILRKGGSVPTAQIRSVRNAYITLDGQTNNFPGLTNLPNASVYLESGARAILQGIRQLTQTNSGDIVLSAQDEGSVLELPNLTEATVPNYYQLELRAYDGGVIRVPQLTGLNGALNAYGQGDQSSIEMAGFRGTLTNATPGQGYIEARDGARVLMPNVTGLHRINLTLRGAGQVSTAQLASLTELTLTIDDQIGGFPGLTNLHGSSVSVQSGGQLTLEGVKRLGCDLNGDIQYLAEDAGSILTFPNVTEVAVPDYYQIEMYALRGGEVHFPKLTKIAGAIEAVADGESSVVDLPALSGRFGNPSPGGAYLEARNAGEVRIAGITELSRVNVTQRNGGAISTAQIKAVFEAEITLDQTAGSFPVLTNLDGSSITLEDGATLTLPGITQIARTNNGSLTFSVSDPGSVLTLPNLRTASVLDYYQLELFAYRGGRLVLPGFSTMNGALDLFADGNGSVVELPSLAGPLVNSTRGPGYIEARNGGAISIPNVTALERYNLIVRGTGIVPTSQLSSIRNSNVLIDGASVTFAGLGDTSGTTFRYENGGTAVFQPPADVVVFEIRVPSTIVANEPTDVTWVLKNIGTAFTNAVWTDQVFVSADNLPGGDELLGSVESSGSMGTNGTLTITKRIIFPARLAGTRHVVISANATRSLFEGLNYTNNIGVSAPVTIQAPDLIVEAPSVQPVSTQFGKPVMVSWTVRNAGTFSATATVTDRLVLAKSQSEWGAGIVLTNVVHNAALVAGASFDGVATVTLPVAANLEDGNYVIVVMADYFGGVAEGSETNNVGSVGISLTRPPLPDLAVDRIQSAATVAPGQTIELTWVTTNKGTATAEGVWEESVFLASTNGLSTNQPLARYNFTNNLAVGSALVRTQLVTIPLEARAGNGRLVVHVDSAGQLAEKNETNNVFAATESIAVQAALTFNLPVTSIAEAAAEPRIGALITRNGDLSVPLTVTLASSDTKELVVPASVTFRAGDISAPVTMSIQRDGIADSNKEVTVTAAALGYNPGSTKVTVLNSDKPKLKVQLAVSALNEGEATDLIVSHDGEFVVPVTVNLRATGNEQILVPPSVTIPAGESAVVVEIGAQDDTRLEGDRSYIIRATVEGFDDGSTTIVVHDNDLPEFTLSLASSSISEGAGPQATFATISRGKASPRSLSVELENSNSSAIAVPSRVVIPAGESSATVPIAALNNAAVDGTRTAVVKAFALTTADSERIAQTTPVTLTVLDDDGPALLVSISRELVAEGLASAATVTVTRNTAPVQPLTVSLASSLPGEATVPGTLVIPLGAASGTVALSSEEDFIADGSKAVQITASAAGYTSGSAMVIVTDVNEPDLVAREVSGPATAETEAFVNVGYRIYNQGLATAGTNWVTKIYLSEDATVGNDTLLNEYTFNGALPVGQFFGQTRQVRMPQGPGKYWIVVETDTAGQIDEILESNNTTISAQPIELNAAYSAVVTADIEAAQAGTPVALRGSAMKASTGGPVPFALANIHINVRGTKRVISALTDERGQFAAIFKPLPGEAGLYEIGAAHPGALTAPIQDSFTLFGMKAEDVPAVRVAEKSSVTGQFALRNLGDRALTKVTVSVDNSLPNLQVTTTLSTNSIGGAGSATVGFAVTATDASVAEGTFHLMLTSAEGATLAVPIKVLIDSLRPRLIVNPAELVRGMKVGDQTLVQFDVINQGGSDSGPINISLPELPWMHLVTPAPLPSLAPQSSNRIVLQLTPAANLTLGAYDGRIVLNSSNASVQVPYNFRALSEAKGDLLISAVDEYTYFAEGSPKVAGATVHIRDAVTLNVVATGVTDGDGRFLIRDLQEGYYELELKADKHTSYRQPHLVLSGKTNEVQAFLRREAVRYIWKVAPTEIRDRTRITIETVFEAFVPMPVITVDPPLIDLADFTAEVTQVDMKVMNHGLITAKEAKLSFAEHPEWSIEPLVGELGDIPARGSFTVPVIVRRLTPGLQRQAGRVHALAGGGCNIAGNCQFVVECGGSKLPGSADVPVINASASGNCGGGGGGGMAGGGGAGGGGSGSAGGSPGDSSASVPTCDKCLLELFKCALDLALPDLASCAKDLYGCQGAIRSGDGGQSAYECMKATINCATAAGKESLGPIGKAIDIAECLNGVPPACLGGGGGGGGGGGNDGGGGNTDTSLVGTLSRQSMRAAAVSGVSRVQRGEFAIVFQRLEWVLDEVSPFRYIMGDDIWFRSGEPALASAWVQTFLQKVEQNTEAGGHVSANEMNQLLAVKLPVAITAQHARTFVERWNRSLDYWAVGITNQAQVPAGQNPDFIALDTLRAYSTASNDSFAQSASQGYESPDLALSQARQELMQFMTEGDGNGVCAHVRLRLEQEAVMTRDAFDASLEIVNDSNEILEKVAVEIQVRRRNGEDATELFGIRPPVLKDINAIDGTGRVVPESVGKISWTLVPTTETALDGPEEFLVSGVLRYLQNGQLNVTVPLAPSSITVLPSPSLAVKYFHERQVFADDPFTVPIEPSVPYSLAVMVQNKGRGVARDVHIDSAQPKIVDNEKGLLADFKIIATQVEEDNLQPSLSVDFGQINPGTNAIGRWLLTSTILGGFIEYSATFEHLDGLGNKKLSLVEGVEIHELIHTVRATGAFDDGRPDFLANDIADLYDRPDTLHLSDGSVQPVSVVLEGTTDRAPTAQNLEVRLAANMPPGWTYLRVADPGEGKFRLVKVTRADGAEVPFGENVWTTDRTFLGNARRPIVENTIHLFDYNSTGSYTLFYAALPDADSTPPVSGVQPLLTESAAHFPVNWAAQDNQGGSGISFYDIYVSVDDGPFRIWISETIDRSAIYQGALGRSYSFYSIATDQAGNREEPPGTPDTRTTVTRTNHAPTMELIADQVLKERAPLEVQAIAFDADGDALTFSLNTNAPAGAVINPYTGKLTWVTSEGSGPKSYNLTIQVLDSGLPRLGAARSFVVTVTDENSPPIITPIADRTINERQELTFTALAMDIDLPAQTVAYSLAAGAPQGAAINTDSGLFRWRPSDLQGGQTYSVGIIARDNGTPVMSSTQTFNVVVRDTRSDVIVTIGTTNVLAGGTIIAPITLGGGADLKEIDFDLSIQDNHLQGIQLTPMGQEVLAAALEFVQQNRYRVRIELDSARVQPGTRTIGALQFGTRMDGRSSIALLGASSLEAIRQNGDRVANTALGSGRIFLIENEPLLDTYQTSSNMVRLVLYGKPGSQLLLQSSSDIRSATNWTDATGLTLSTTFHSSNWPMQTNAPVFFRLNKVN